MSTKIISEQFKQYSSLILKERITKHSFYSAIFLNFDTNEVHFSNEKMTGKFHFDYEGDKHENFWVDSKQFFHILNSYSELLIEDKIFYSSTKEESFKLPTMDDEDYEFPEYDFDSSLYEIDITFNYPIALLKSFIKPSDEVLNGYFFDNKKLTVTDRTLIHVRPSGLDYEEDFVIPSEVFQDFNQLFKDQKLKLVFVTKDLHQLRISDTDIIQYVVSDDLNIPDLSGDDFANENYDLPDNVFFKSSDLMEALEFLLPIAKDNPSSRIFLSFEDQDILKVEIRDFKTHLKKKVKLTQQHFLENSDTVLSVSAEDLYLILRSLEEFKELKMTFDSRVDTAEEEFSPILIFREKDSDTFEHFSLFTKLADEDIELEV